MTHLSPTQQIGQHAENIARIYLEKKGLKHYLSNYRCYSGEIDLIMLDLVKKEIVFVEVRSRANTRYGSALDTVDVKKINKLIRTATHFLQSKRWLYKKNSRFDIIAIHSLTDNMQLDWIKNAFTMDN